MVGLWIFSTVLLAWTVTFPAHKYIYYKESQDNVALYEITDTKMQNYDLTEESSIG